MRERRFDGAVRLGIFNSSLLVALRRPRGRAACAIPEWLRSAAVAAAGAPGRPALPDYAEIPLANTACEALVSLPYNFQNVRAIERALADHEIRGVFRDNPGPRDAIVALIAARHDLVHTSLPVPPACAPRTMPSQASRSGSRGTLPSVLARATATPPAAAPAGGTASGRARAGRRPAFAPAPSHLRGRATGRRLRHPSGLRLAQAWACTMRAVGSQK